MMKGIRKAAAAALCLALFCTAGCIPRIRIDKDRALAVYNGVLLLAGSAALTRDGHLAGERTFGADRYVGSYAADYADFSGREYLFGNTAIERENGKRLEVVCTIEGEAGELKLFFSSGEDAPEVLLDGTGRCTKVLELPDGSNYLGVEGSGFTGSFTLTVSDAPSAADGEA